MRSRTKQRKTPGSVRKSRRKPQPTTGWLMREFAPLVGLQKRTINYYVHAGLVPKPPLHGVHTRYQRKHLLHLLALIGMQRREKLPLAQIKARLSKMSDQDLDAYLEPLVQSDLARSALGYPTLPPLPTASAGPTATQTATAPGPATGGDSKIASAPNAALPPYQGWLHVPILPGLELRVKSDASPLVHQLARDFYAHCVGAAS